MKDGQHKAVSNYGEGDGIYQAVPFVSDPANDGPEVEVIRFFSRFKNGGGPAGCRHSTPFQIWKRVASMVNPNA